MTVSTTDNVISYTGDASTVAFSFPYLFYVNSHLKVYVDDVLKTITTHYTVTGAENPAGGTVTFVTAPAAAAEIIIQRVAPTTQETDLENFDGNPADVTEKQFDLLAMVDQQLTEQVARTISAPLGTTLTTNVISGTIDATARLITITTSGPAIGPTVASFDTATATAVAAAATATTQAGLASTAKTNAETAETNAESQVTYAEEWAQNPEDDPVSVAAGGDDSTTYSALHWAAKAFDFAQSVNLPALGAANTVLQVNAGGTANEYEKIKALNVDINAATDTVITASDEIWFADATDSNLVKKDTVQGILDLISGLSNGGVATNRYYHGFGYSGNTTGTQTVTANRHYATPFHIADTDTFTRIGMEITTGAAGLARLGIYTWVDGLPGTLILDCGTVDTTSIALVEATISQTLTPGTYAVTAVFNATPTVRNKSGQEVVTHFFGEVGNAGSSDAPGSLYNSFSYAALPASFGGSVTYVNLGSTAPISLWLRKV